MDVYFGENYWGCQKGGHRDVRKIGRRKALGKAFEWNGHLWQVPAVYLSEEGLTADFCVQVPMREIQEFLEEWEKRKGQEEWMERENPLACEDQVALKVGGREAEPAGGCQTCWYPGKEGREAHDKAADGLVPEELLMKAYGCCRDSCWRFLRRSFYWPDGSGKVDSPFQFSFRRGPVCYPGPHFVTREDAKGMKVDICHPVNGRKYCLTVTGYEAGILPADGISARTSAASRLPRHFQMLQYTLEPEFAQQELQIQDCAEDEGGPTSFFLVGKPQAPGTHVACSSLHAAPVEQVEWSIRFWVDDGQELKVEI